MSDIFEGVDAVNVAEEDIFAGVDAVNVEGYADDTFAEGMEPDYPIEEQHPDVSTSDRVASKHSPVAFAREMAKKGIEVRQNKYGETVVRKQGEPWKVVDPVGFDWGDVTDFASDVPPLVLGTLGTVAGSVGGPAGMVGGGVAGGLAGEGINQAALSALGYDLEPEEQLRNLAFEGAAGVLAPVGGKALASGGKALARGAAAGKGAVKRGMADLGTAIKGAKAPLREEVAAQAAKRGAPASIAEKRVQKEIQAEIAKTARKKSASAAQKRAKTPYIAAQALARKAGIEGVRKKTLGELTEELAEQKIPSITEEIYQRAIGPEVSASRGALAKEAIQSFDPTEVGNVTFLRKGSKPGAPAGTPREMEFQLRPEDSQEIADYSRAVLQNFKDPGSPRALSSEKTRRDARAFLSELGIKKTGDLESLDDFSGVLKEYIQTGINRGGRRPGTEHLATVIDLPKLKKRAAASTLPPSMPIKDLPEAWRSFDPKTVIKLIRDGKPVPLDRTARAQAWKPVLEKIPSRKTLSEGAAVAAEALEAPGRFLDSLASGFSRRKGTGQGWGEKMAGKWAGRALGAAMGFGPQLAVAEAGAWSLRALSRKLAGDTSGGLLKKLAAKSPPKVRGALLWPLKALQERGEDAYRTGIWLMMRQPEARNWLNEELGVGADRSYGAPPSRASSGSLLVRSGTGPGR